MTLKKLITETNTQTGKDTTHERPRRDKGEVMCESVFACVFEAVFGFGLAIIALILLAALLGLLDDWGK